MLDSTEAGRSLLFPSPPCFLCCPREQVEAGPHPALVSGQQATPYVTDQGAGAEKRDLFTATAVPGPAQHPMLLLIDTSSHNEAAVALGPRLAGDSGGSRQSLLPAPRGKPLERVMGREMEREERGTVGLPRGEGRESYLF